jgi:hypothetical protein
MRQHFLPKLFAKGFTFSKRTPARPGEEEEEGGGTGPGSSEDLFRGALSIFVFIASCYLLTHTSAHYIILFAFPLAGATWRTQTHRPIYIPHVGITKKNTKYKKLKKKNLSGPRIRDHFFHTP